MCCLLFFVQDPAAKKACLLAAVLASGVRNQGLGGSTVCCWGRKTLCQYIERVWGYKLPTAEFNVLRWGIRGDMMRSLVLECAVADEYAVRAGPCTCDGLLVIWNFYPRASNPNTLH